MPNSLIVLLVFIVALVARLISINQSLWLDEATSILVARNYTFQEILTKFSPGDFHPPLYYLLLKLWISIFGFSEIGARSLSVILGSLTVVIVFLIGKHILGHKGGFISALFFATAPLHIYYSQEARMYVFTAFLVSLCCLLFLKLLRKSRYTLLYWVLLFLTSVAIFYTDYPAISIFLFLAIYLLVYEKEHLRTNIGKWGMITILTLVSFVPWINTFLLQLDLGGAVRTNTPIWWETLGKTNIKQLMLVPVKFTIGRISSYNKLVYFVSVLIALAPAVFLFLTATKNWKDTKFLWLWLAIPLMLAMLIGIRLSVFNYFRYIFVLPAFYLLLTAGVLSFKNINLQKGFIVAILTINIFSSSVYWFNPRFHREDWRASTDWIETHSTGLEAATVFVTKNQRDAYFYYAKNVPSFGANDWKNRSFNTLWLIRYVQPIFDAKDNVREKIEKAGFVKIDERDFNGVVIWRYEKI